MPTPVAWRWLFTLGLLGSLAVVLDLDELWQQLRRLPPSLLLPAFLLTGVQVALSAWRWRFTAQRLGLRLPYDRAVREYYLASFLNQVLPGGVVGDVGRAWRHSQHADHKRGAVHAVVIERLSGQLALLLVVVAALWWLAPASDLFPGEPALWLLLISVGVMVAAWLIRRSRRAGHYLANLQRDLSRTLFGWRVFAIQLGTSLLVLASYLALFLVLAQQAGYLASGASWLLVAGLCSLLLLSMVIPVTVAGWGVREGAAAVLWPLAGLPAEQGVALSVGYGILVLVSSTPGLLVLVWGQAKPGLAQATERGG